MWCTFLKSQKKRFDQTPAHNLKIWRRLGPDPRGPPQVPVVSGSNGAEVVSKKKNQFPILADDCPCAIAPVSSSSTSGLRTNYPHNCFTVVGLETRDGVAGAYGAVVLDYSSSHSC
jgi:hypothetical protein